MQGLVNLLCQFSCGRHDNAIYGIGRVVAVGQFREDGQQVCRRLAGSRLGNAQKVPTFYYWGNGMLLYGSSFPEVHVVQRIKHWVAEIQIVEIHYVVL